MNSRYREMLMVHWKAVRWILVPFVLVCFGLPMLTLRIAQVVPEGATENAAALLYYQSSWITLFPLLAFVCGGAIGLTAWSWDHHSRHVYALTLPVTRAQYTLTKFAAGLALVAIPVMALFAGTLLGVALTRVPSELHAYPFSFTARFLLATMISYALVFSLASSTVKTTVTIIVVFLAIIIGGEIISQYVNAAAHRYVMVSPGELLLAAFIMWPGPLSVFGGSWVILDV